jgi:hypothetical protein
MSRLSIFRSISGQALQMSGCNGNDREVCSSFGALAEKYLATARPDKLKIDYKPDAKT